MTDLIISQLNFITPRSTRSISSSFKGNTIVVKAYIRGAGRSQNAFDVSFYSFFREMNIKHDAAAFGFGKDKEKIYIVFDHPKAPNYGIIPSTDAVSNMLLVESIFAHFDTEIKREPGTKNALALAYNSTVEGVYIFEKVGAAKKPSINGAANKLPFE